MAGRWKSYDTDAVGDYSEDSVFAQIDKYGDEGGWAGPKPASEPAVGIRPGSQDKINLLCARAEMGEELWHPEDEVLPCELLGTRGKGEYTRVVLGWGRSNGRG